LPGPTYQFLICFIPDWIGHGSYGLLCRQGLRKGCGTVPPSSPPTLRFMSCFPDWCSGLCSAQNC